MPAWRYVDAPKVVLFRDVGNDFSDALAVLCTPIPGSLNRVVCRFGSPRRKPSRLLRETLDVVNLDPRNAANAGRNDQVRDRRQS